MPNTEDSTKGDNRKYEINFLLRREEDRKEVKEIMERHGAEIIAEGLSTRIKLSYPVKKENFAFFNQVIFSAAPESLREISHDLKANNLVLRFMLGDGEKAKILTREQPREITKEELKEEKGTSEILTESKAEEIKAIRDRVSGVTFRGELSNEALEKKLEEILKE